MLLIKNGYLTDPRSGREEKADILIKNNRIIKIGNRQDFANLLQSEEVQEYDAKGLIVAPGLVDVHVHFRDPGFTYKEDIESGSRVAAAGGFTTVVLMANTKPVVDNAETLSYVLEKGRQTGIHVESCASVTVGMKGQTLTAMETLLKAGAVGFTDDGIPLLNEKTAREAMANAAKLQTVLSFHEEDPSFITNNGINAGAIAKKLGIGGSGREAEITMVARDLRLAEETGATISIQHISSKEAVELIRQAKKSGIKVHAEATPHHFSLTEKAVEKYGTLAKMNPPLREEKDLEAIRAGLKDDTIDLIATDHAPHSSEEKGRPLTEAPSGIIGLETSLSLGITNLVRTETLTMMQLLEKMTWNPAKLYGLDCGYLGEGGPADLVIFSVQEKKTYHSFQSKSWNSPFTNETLYGKIKCTICNGCIVYENNE